MRDQFLSIYVDDIGKSDTYIMLEKKLNLGDCEKEKNEEIRCIKSASDKVGTDFV